MITRQKILDFIENTQHLRGDDVTDISNLSDRFPYCQTLQLLKIIGLRNNDDIEYKNQLNLASVYSGDRSLLYEYIIRENLLQTIATQEEEPTNIVTPAAAEISQPASTENSSAPPHTEANDVSEAPEQETIINPLPLEEQILQAAIIHTAELEVDHSLAQLPELKKPSASAETQQENQELSFAQWLLKIDKSPQQEQEAISAPASKKSPVSDENKLIDTFIHTKPQISPVKASFFSPVNMGKMSLIEDETFVTETLANIYLRQGEYQKALRAYRNLSLKFPEKKTYFARLIKEAEEKIQKKN